MTEKTQWVEPPRDHPHIIRARFEVEYAPYFGKAAKGVSEGTSLLYLPNLSRGQEVDLSDLRGFVERWSFSNRSFSWLESITFRVRGWELHLTIRGRVSPRDGVQQSYVEPVAFNSVKSIDLTSALASLAGRDNGVPAPLGPAVPAGCGPARGRGVDLLRRGARARPTRRRPSGLLSAATSRSWARR